MIEFLNYNKINYCFKGINLQFIQFNESYLCSIVYSINNIIIYTRIILYVFNRIVIELVSKLPPILPFQFFGAKISRSSEQNEISAVDQKHE